MVGVGGDEPGAAQHQVDRLCQDLEVDSRPLPHHDKVSALVVRYALIRKRHGEATAADREVAKTRFFRRQPLQRRVGRRHDAVDRRRWQAYRLEVLSDLLRGTDRVVGDKAVGVRCQRVEKPGRTRRGSTAVEKHTIHVDQQRRVSLVEDHCLNSLSNRGS